MNANSQNVFNAIQSSVISQSVSSSKNEVKLICTSNFMGREIKVYGSAENPLFLAKDVAEWIDYSKSGNGSYNITQMLSSVDEDEKMIRTIRTDDTTKNVSREVWLLTEDGLYDVLMLSRKPIAKQFKKGVKEILKTIRKTGSYSVALPSYQISDPIKRAEKWIEEETIRQQLQSENQERQKQIEEQQKAIGYMTGEIIELKKKTDYLDIILSSKGTVTITQIAQDYGMSAKAFNKVLAEMKIQRKVNGQWILYAPYMSEGYVHSKPVTITHKDGTPDVVMNTEWTQRGRIFLYGELKGKGVLPLIEKRP